MASLTAKRRRALPKSDFTLPKSAAKSAPKGAKGSYPIDTPGRARAALSYSKRFASSSEQATIRRKVKARYPSIQVGGKKK